MTTDTMTSRQRVEAALNHEPTDRVPIDVGGTRVSGIASLAYARLLEHLGMSEPIYLYDIKQQLALPSLDVVNRLGGDVVLVNRLAPTTGMPFLCIDHWKDSQLTDGTACLAPAAYEARFKEDGTVEVLHQGEVAAYRTPGSLYFDISQTPLKHAQTQADIDAFVFPDPWTEREAAFLKDQVQQLHGTDKALFGGLTLLNQSFFEIGATLFGYETFMMNLVLQRNLMEHWLDRLLAHDLEILDAYLAITGPYLSVIHLNDDFGAQEALQISPTLYREMFKPRQKKWIEWVKARTNAKIFFHCDGAVEELLPDFIEIGIDILNPLQTNARGMDPGTIKRKYGKTLSFWGAGVETQSTLPFGSLEDIKQEVRERIKLLGRDGGYVFGTIHNIQADITPEKILAAFETAMQTSVG